MCDANKCPRLFPPRGSALCALLILICAGVSAQSSFHDSVILQLPWKHQFQFAGYCAAIEKGFYQEQGLEVTIRERAPGLIPIDEVISRKANFGVARSEVLLERLQGAPLVVLASIFQHSPTILLAKMESGIYSPQDMVGKRVTIGSKKINAETYAMFLMEGVSIDDFELVGSTFNLAHLIEGKVDAATAYITDQPYVLEKKAVPYTAIRPIAYGVDFYGDCLFTTEEEIKAHPGRLKSFREASLRGWRYAFEHSEEIISLIMTKYGGHQRGLTQEQLRFEAETMRKLILPDLVEMGHMNPGRWEHMAGIFARLGMVDPGYNLEGFIYDHSSPRFDWNHPFLKLTAGVFLLTVILILAVYNRKLKIEIVQRKSAESEVSALARFPDEDPHPVIRISREGKILYGNEPSAPLLKEWQVDGDGFVSSPWKQLVLDALNAESNLQTEAECGGMIFNVIFSPVVKSDYVNVYCLDITESKRALDALSESEERFRQLAENIREVFWIGAPDWNAVYYISSTYEEVWGRACETLYERPRAWLDSVLPEDREQVIADINTMSAGDFSDEKFRDYRIERPDGSIRWISARAYPVLDESGEVYRIVGISEDVSERKRYSERLEEMVQERTAELRKAQGELLKRERLAVLGQLAGGVGHEMRNPLGVINNAAYYLNSVYGQGDEKMREYLQIISSEVRNAEKIVSDLLNLSRSKPAERQWVVLSEVVLRVLESYEVPQGVEVDVDVPEGLAEVYVDAHHVQQVLLNLVANGCQAMEEGGGVLGVSGEEVEGGVELRVTDSGCGIKSEDIARVFEPLFTTKARGIGLGLAVSKNLVEVNGGRIEVESEEGKGSTFRVFLPSERLPSEEQQ